jgi:hypothetical protein
MGFFGQTLTLIKVIGIVWIVVALLWMLKGAVFWLGGLLVRMANPLEFRLLQWLQDRATARTLGIDIDILRMRRKMDFPRH